MSDYRRAQVAGGCFFFTVVTHHRQHLFAERANVDRLRAGVRSSGLFGAVGMRMGGAKLIRSICAGWPWTERFGGTASLVPPLGLGGMASVGRLA
jgi:hypothetical protein